MSDTTLPVPPPVDSPAPAPLATTSEENKFRRLHEKAEAEKTALQTRLTELEADAKKRAEAEMSEAQKAASRAEAAEKKAQDAEARALRAEHERTRERVLREHNLQTDDADFLTASDEDGLRAQAERLVKRIGSTPPPTAPPVRAGSVTNPGTQPPMSYQEKLDKALREGRDIEAINLIREEQFGKQ